MSKNTTPAQKRLLQKLIDREDFRLEHITVGRNAGRWELYDPHGPCGINRHTAGALFKAGLLRVTEERDGRTLYRPKQ